MNNNFTPNNRLIKRNADENIDFKAKENLNFKKRRKYDDNLSERVESPIKCEPQSLTCRLNLNIMSSKKCNKLLEKLKYFQKNDQGNRFLKIFHLKYLFRNE